MAFALLLSGAVFRARWARLRTHVKLVSSLRTSMWMCRSRCHALPSVAGPMVLESLSPRFVPPPFVAFRGGAEGIKVF